VWSTWRTCTRGTWQQSTQIQSLNRLALHIAKSGQRYREIQSRPAKEQSKIVKLLGQKNSDFILHIHKVGTTMVKRVTQITCPNAYGKAEYMPAARSR
jgi:hypothetical protein